MYPRHSWRAALAIVAVLALCCHFSAFAFQQVNIDKHVEEKHRFRHDHDHHERYRSNTPGTDHDDNAVLADEEADEQDKDAAALRKSIRASDRMHHHGKQVPLVHNAPAYATVHTAHAHKRPIGAKARSEMRQRLASKGIIPSDDDAKLHIDHEHLQEIEHNGGRPDPLGAADAAELEGPEQTEQDFGFESLSRRDQLKEMIKERRHFYPVQQPVGARQVVMPNNWERFVCQVCTAFAREYNEGLNERTLSFHPSRILEQAEINVTDFYTWTGEAKMATGPDGSEPTTALHASGVFERTKPDDRWSHPPQTPEESKVRAVVKQLLHHYLLNHYDREIYFYALHELSTEQRPPTMPWLFIKEDFCIRHKRVCPEMKSSLGGHGFGNLKRLLSGRIHSLETQHSATHPYIHDLWEERELERDIDYEEAKATGQHAGDHPTPHHVAHDRMTTEERERHRATVERQLREELEEDQRRQAQEALQAQYGEL